MSEYEKDILINELQKLVVSKSMDISIKNYEIGELKKSVESLKAEVERLENLLTPKVEMK